MTPTIDPLPEFAGDATAEFDRNRAQQPPAELASVWVLISPQLLDQLIEGWSEPVQLLARPSQLRHHTGAPVLELTARTVTEQQLLEQPDPCPRCGGDHDRIDPVTTPCPVEVPYSPLDLDRGRLG